MIVTLTDYRDQRNGKNLYVKDCEQQHPDELLSQAVHSSALRDWLPEAGVFLMRMKALI